MVFLKEFLEKVDLKKKSADNKKAKNLPGSKELIQLDTIKICFERVGDI